MEAISFEAIEPADPVVRTALTRYLTELLTRGAASALDAEEIEDVEDYRPPTGVFLVGRGEDDKVVGCGAVRALGPGLGEIKRMWIDPRWRGQGNGARLIAALEDSARQLGYGILRLDTSEELVEAVHLYQRSGYRAIDRYNENPDATLFFEKQVDPASTPDS